MTVRSDFGTHLGTNFAADVVLNSNTDIVTNVVRNIKAMILVVQDSKTSHSFSTKTSRKKCEGRHPHLQTY